MRRIWNRLFGGECVHPHTVVVNSVGFRRSVCERCGNISFKMIDSSVSKTQQPPSRRSDLPKVSGL